MIDLPIMNKAAPEGSVSMPRFDWRLARTGVHWRPIGLLRTR